MNGSGDRGTSLRLDDLYHMTAYIYGDQNLDRHPTATFAHFVEVCGLLCSLDRNKRRGELQFEDALAKALGWFFPLMAKFGISSIEEVIFRKYPMACPYCRRAPHNDAVCKAVRGLAKGVLDHGELRRLFHERWSSRPASLDEWQRMFQDIYPRSTDDRTGRSSLGLLEELGELAEAIRVFERYPKYVIGEAADVFSYLMGLANEHWLRLAREDRRYSCEDEFILRYPGLCIDCGNRVCTCPPVPNATVGRMAKELDTEDSKQLFGAVPVRDPQRAALVGGTILSRLSGSAELIERFPVDRGEAHTAIVEMCRSLAGSLDAGYPGLAESLRSNADRLAGMRTDAGEKAHSEDARALVTEVVGILNESPSDAVQQSAAPVLGSVIVPRRKHVLVVTSCPLDATTIRSTAEGEIVREAIRRSRYRDQFEVDHLAAAKFDDLRRRLLDNDQIAVVHFAGHGTEGGLAFEDDEGMRRNVSINVLADYLSRYPQIECVVLNACYSLADLVEPIATVTVGMEEALDDDSGIEFARGFYDAVGAGRDYEFAAEEGKWAVEGKGLPALQLRVLT